MKNQKNILKNLLAKIQQDESLTWYEKQNRTNLINRYIAIYNCYVDGDNELVLE